MCLLPMNRQFLATLEKRITLLYFTHLHSPCESCRGKENITCHTKGFEYVIKCTNSMRKADMGHLYSLQTVIKSSYNQVSQSNTKISPK